ncbi:hypothetical protein F0562_032663 [Nyssa sinensis]|uniref:Uncharacterized protein n=1 Tax=Nyssa sinensis TaxID=561372 RepID=A0A5J5AU51_9ASTE|nr:hypothetical protein F0562_032663 [Nyssa sinensis]
MLLAVIDRHSPAITLRRRRPSPPAVARQSSPFVSKSRPQHHHVNAPLLSWACYVRSWALETSIRNQGKQKEDAPYGSTSHMGNLLFEEQSSIQARAICLDFPKFDGEEPNGWIYRAN